MILAMGHQRYTGKGTAAAFLVEQGFIELNFADPLKDGADTIFGFTKEQRNDPVLKETIDPFWGITPRYAYQRFGTEAVRKVFGDDFWIRALQRRIVQTRAADIVISDLRHTVEAKALKAMGAYMVKITRPGIEPQKDADGTTHPSETELLDYTGWDGVIVNAGTKEDLGRKIMAMVSDFREKAHA